MKQAGKRVIEEKDVCECSRPTDDCGICGEVSRYKIEDINNKCKECNDDGWVYQSKAGNQVINVNVDMEGQFLGTKVLHVKATLPYPMLEFDKLNSVDQFKWMWRYG